MRRAVGADESGGGPPQSGLGFGLGRRPSPPPAVMWCQKLLTAADGAVLCVAGTVLRIWTPTRRAGLGVAHFIHSLEAGGMQRQFIECARLRRSWAFWSWADTPGPFEAELRREGIEIPRIYARLRRNLLLHALAFFFPLSTALVWLWRLFCLQRPACVWGWGFLASVVVAPAARLAGVPRVVIRVENLSAWKTWPPHRRWWNRPADQHAARLADVVVVNAPAVVEDYAAWARVDPRRIMVIPNGVNSAEWLARPWRDRRPELGISADEVVVLSGGRLSREKNQALLVYASARLHAQGLLHHLIVVGEGPLRRDLERLARQLGIEPWTHWVGETEAPQDFYRSANVFVLSSEIEGLPNALLEAQVFGLPVVTTAAGGAGWVIRAGETGFVVPVGDQEALAAALSRLVADGELRHRLGAAGQAYVALEFSTQRWVQRLDEASQDHGSAREGQG